MNCHLSRLALVLSLLALFPGSVVAGSRHQQSRPIVVVLDPGHGGQSHFGDESGAVSADGTLLEKTLTLQVAKTTQAILQAAGYAVYLTRTSDQHANTPPRDLNHDGKIDHIDEYNARTQFANRMHADAFVSIHFDGNGDPGMRGTHGYYCPARPFWKDSKRLATLITADISTALKHAGYDDPNNGVETDVADVVPQSRADYPWFLVLGPARKHWITATKMPGALIESLYLSSPRDDAEIKRKGGIAAIARGYADGIEQYFGGKSTK